MSESKSPSGRTPGLSTDRQLTGLINRAQSLEKQERDEAFHELYKYVAGPMKELIAACVRRLPGGPFQITEAINDAVGSLFLKWSNLDVGNTGHYRALVVQAVYWKVTGQRRANRRLHEAISGSIAAPAISGAVLHAQDRFEEAVEALANYERQENKRAKRHETVSQTPLADVVKARHLIGMSNPARTEAGAITEETPIVTTFKAVSELLGIDSTLACKCYWKALEWLHKNYPDVVPRLPERKRAGRKRNDPSHGDAT